MAGIDTIDGYLQMDGLHLQGNCGYSVVADSVLIEVEAVVSDRPTDNLSGTLMLALVAQHDQGEEQCRLAYTEMGELFGQCLFPATVHELPFTSPPAGLWWLSLQLLEWDGEDYRLRDSMTFAVPYLVEQTLGLVSDSGAASQMEQQAPEQRTPEQQTPEQTVTLKKKRKATRSKKSGSTGTGAGDVVADGKRINVNTASEAELAAIKGISKKLAAALVAARPIANEAAILKVKGMGGKTWSRVSGQLQF